MDYSRLEHFFVDIIRDPVPYLLILIWIYISWRMARDEGESFMIRALKNFGVFVGLAIFHEILPWLFWIVFGVSLIISIIAAAKQQKKRG